jgi:hypothetical protein
MRRAEPVLCKRSFTQKLSEIHRLRSAEFRDGDERTVIRIRGENVTAFRMADEESEALPGFAHCKNLF